MAILARKIRFTAAHRYYRSEWSESRSREVFGPCSNPHAHGHRCMLEESVRGGIDGETGFSVDLRALDSALEWEVVQLLEHEHLNHAVQAFREGGLVPTTENLLAYLWPRLAAAIPPGAELHPIRLHEDHTLYVDYFGGGQGAWP